MRAYLNIVRMLGLALLMCAVSAAQAAAPMVKTQPGFYRMMLGDFEVTALNDGVVAYSTIRVLPTATPEQIEKHLRVTRPTSSKARDRH